MKPRFERVGFRFATYFRARVLGSISGFPSREQTRTSQRLERTNGHKVAIGKETQGRKEEEETHNSFVSPMMHTDLWTGSSRMLFY